MHLQNTHPPPFFLQGDTTSSTMLLPSLNHRLSIPSAPNIYTCTTGMILQNWLCYFCVLVLVRVAESSSRNQASKSKLFSSITYRKKFIIRHMKSCWNLKVIRLKLKNICSDGFITRHAPNCDHSTYFQICKMCELMSWAQSTVGSTAMTWYGGSRWLPLRHIMTSIPTTGQL